MRKVLTSLLFALALAAGAAAQESKVDTAVDKTKSAGAEVGDKAEDVKDQTVKGAKKVGSATKKGVNEVGDKAEDVGDKAGDVKDATVHGAKKAGHATKKGVNEVGDKAEDVGDATAKGAKKSGNWIKRTWRKIF